MKENLLNEMHNHLLYWQRLGANEIVAGGNMTAVVQRKKKLDSGSTTLEAIQAELGDCTRCKLSEGRTNLVFGVGNPNARILFIGEGPGADEDAKGEPFVGRAGKLLTKIILAMGLQREDVYIANVVKCRPPQNRAPLPEEASTCIPFLFKQIEAIAPEVIVGLGSTAVKHLLGDDNLKISELRGKFQTWRNTKLMPTYHPAYLLRNPNMKKPVWEDMQKVMEELGMPKPN